MQKKVLQRLEKLKVEEAPPIIGIVWAWRQLKKEDLDADERIVDDVFFRGERVFCIQERVTTDPSDQGKNYSQRPDGLWILNRNIIRREIVKNGSLVDV